MANDAQSIVTIPGVGTLAPDAWRENYAKPWLKCILEGPAQKAQVWQYEHDLSFASSQLLQDLLEEGGKLLRSLEQLPRSQDVGRAVARYRRY